MELDKKLRIGSVDVGGSTRATVWVHVVYHDGKLSITGVEGPMRNGECRGGCGQICISTSPQDIAPADGWTTEAIGKLWSVWDKWHLNDMRAGSPEQMAWLESHPIDATYPASHYDVASKALADAGLNPDSNGYKYGHAWLREDVPQDVLDWLESLPEADSTPAWI